MVFLRLCVSLLLLLSASAAMAEEVAPVSCSVTPSLLALDSEPEVFSKTNNLRRRIGSPVTAHGVPIIIKGRLLDERCVPVSDAIIEIWQANPQGVMIFPNMRKKQNIHSDFLGSGTASTDNMGRFEFLTLMPGASRKEAAHINLRIKHSAFDEFETIAFFGDSGKKQATLTALSGDASFGKRYQLVITLPGKGQYRTY